jgi:tRNA(Ile)-lysidine synthase
VLTAFVNHIRVHQLFHPTQKVLLGVSGGVDSMVMAELFKRSGFNFAIAHCNFSLRGSESDDDEEHVKKYSMENEILFFSRRFNVTEYSQQNRISIQMAARELRIQWFEALLKEHNFDFYATAHHQDDQIETFFINLLRGTGISGIRGMPHKQGNLIHPMLFLGRKEINDFAKKNRLQYREDSSNQKTDYLRNKIRHKILPAFEAAGLDFKYRMVNNMQHFRSVEALYRIQINNLIQKVLRDEGDMKFVNIEALNQIPEKITVLFEIIRPYGFGYSDAFEISNHFYAQPGKKFLSSTHRIIKDRDYLIIEPQLEDRLKHFYLIFEEDQGIDFPVTLSFQYFDSSDGYSLPDNPIHAILDAALLKFPLVLRKWNKGDFFYPLGMVNRKLLSDFFIDQKLSIAHKEKVWILTSGNDVVWVVGYRIDDRFKVTAETSRIIEFRLETQLK